MIPPPCQSGWLLTGYCDDDDDDNDKHDHHHHHHQHYYYYYYFYYYYCYGNGYGYCYFFFYCYFYNYYKNMLPNWMRSIPSTLKHHVYKLHISKTEKLWNGLQTSILRLDSNFRAASKKHARGET